jgi:hypothetical protein
MNTPQRTLLAVAALVSVTVPSSHAYVTNSRWISNSATIRLHGLSFPNASPELNAFVAAKEEWNLNPSNFRFNLLFGDTFAAVGNGESETWFSPVISAPAETWPVFDQAGWIVEKDIIFKSDFCWSFNYTNYAALDAYGASPCRLMEATAVHELGHALGLEHEADEYNVMGSAFSHLHVNGSMVDAYVGEDASAGAVALYGQPAGAGDDVSVTHWKWDEVGTGTDEYSHHMRVQLFNSSGTALLPTVGGTNRFKVNRGQRIQIEFTYENSGANDQSPLVYLVLSPDNWITRYDRLLGTQTPGLIRNNVYTRKYAVTVPADATPGLQYIGAVVDPLDEIDEVDETNNATWTVIDVL